MLFCYVDKKTVIDEIIRIEGGYVNDPLDSGGATIFGITEAVARANGYPGRMGEMPRSLAFSIYATKYWDAVRASTLVTLSPEVAEEVVDTSVNMGPQRAAIFLQRSLNVLNRGGVLYADIQADGSIGKATIAALKAYLAKRDTEVLTRMLNCLQGAFYVELAERREKDETFVYGWFKNRVKL